MGREVVLFIAASIDGYIAEKDGGIAWLEENIHGQEEDASYEEMLATVDTVVMGRTTYDQVTQELMPDAYPYEEKISYVITSRKEPSTESLIFTEIPPVALIQQLKEEEGAGIWIIGGTSIVTPLIEADLIDRYILTTMPILLGEGIPLFLPTQRQIPLTLERVYEKNQLVYSVYQRMGRDKK